MERMPLDVGFNAAVRHMATLCWPMGYDVAYEPEAPEATMRALADGARLRVWAGGSELTMYASRQANYDFRAWHDWCHWRYGLGFTLPEERRTAMVQATMLLQAFGHGPMVQGWLKLLWAEVLGQAEHYERHGAFPCDQWAFVQAYVANGPMALNVRW